MRRKTALLAIPIVAGISMITVAAVAAAPLVSTTDPAALGSTTATLQCVVNPGGLSTNVWITYKPTSAAWGSASVVTTPQQVVSGSADQTVAFSITGLTAATSYDQRCKAKNADVATPVVTATYVFVTTGTDPSPSPSPSPSPTESPSPSPSPSPTSTSGDIVLAVGGDICDADPVSSYGIGCRGTANQILAANPTAVIAAGDMQYGDFAESTTFQTEWGPFKDKTIPVLGNHDDKTTAATNAYNAYWGAQAHVSTDYQWREDLGKWSVIVVNTEYSASGIPAANKTAVQNLINAANADGDNIVMTFHAPRWSSPCNGCHGSQVKAKYWYDLAYANGVDLIVAAHDHRYERFAPMSGTGVAADGVREFIIGSGGAHPDGSDGTPIAGSQFIKGGFVGVTFFTLSDTSYSWSAREVTNVNGTDSVFDSGTESVR